MQFDLPTERRVTGMQMVSGAFVTESHSAAMVGNSEANERARGCATSPTRHCCRSPTLLGV